MAQVQVGMVLVEGIVLDRSEMSGYVRLETSGSMVIVDRADAIAQVLCRVTNTIVETILAGERKSS